MKKLILSLLAIILLTACTGEEVNKNFEPLDVTKEPEIKIKSPEEWLELVSEANTNNNDIASFLDTQTCIPKTSESCQSNSKCMVAEPSTFLFVTTFDPNTGSSSSLTRNVYRCSDLNGCEKREYSAYEEDDGTLKLQTKDREILISADGSYEDESVIGLNAVTNSGTCYYRDELNIATKKVETANKLDEICTIPESNFGIDWIGVNGEFTLDNDTELRASPIIMDCNVLAIVPKGQKIQLQTETDGAANGEDSWIWLKISFEGQTGWIRGDYVDDRFKQ